MERTVPRPTHRRTTGIPFGRACSVLATAALLLLAGTGSGCTSTGRASATVSDLAWPAEAPRVRLLTVLTPRNARTSRLVRLFTGEEPEPVLHRPYGIAWDGEDLLLTDPGAGAVLRIDPRGRVVASSGADLPSPIGIAACAAGVVVTDSQRGEVLLLGPDLTVRDRLATGLARPTGVACAGGEIFVAETGAHRIRVLAAEADRPALRTLGSRGSEAGAFNFPTSLALDGDGLWVGDTLNFRLQRIDPGTGAALATFGRLGDAPGQMPRVKGLAVDAAGRLWVADAHLDAVSMFRSDGTYLMSVGRSGTAPGTFSFPAGVAAGAHGKVAVVDSFNRRIQVFGPSVTDLEGP